MKLDTDSVFAVCGLKPLNMKFLNRSSVQINQKTGPPNRRVGGLCVWAQCVGGCEEARAAKVEQNAKKHCAKQQKFGTVGGGARTLEGRISSTGKGRP